ncbi:MAG: HD domain-containing protein, partial [Phycisphaeraceae bacterium]|nr:HD domain-containing protein [Phycisphaeraceae bacterium]
SVKATHGFGDEPPRELSFIEDGIHGWVLKIGTPMIIEHADQNGGLPLLAFEKTRMIAAPIQVGSHRIGALSVMRPNREGGYREEDMLFLGTISSVLGGQIGIVRSDAQGKEAVRKAIEALTLALDARDAYTRGHSQRVAIYSLTIANELERDGRHSFGNDRRNSLLMSALLHDVGKIGIRDEILLKPGKLTEEEYALIKSHPEKGAEIVQAIPGFDEEVVEGILHHHERWDGKGYPSGQSGERIHIFGRVIGLADAFDAIVTSRPYSSGESYDFAIGRIEELAGVTFDLDVVQAMLRAFQDRSVLADLGQISDARVESETVQAEVKGVDRADRTLRRIFGRDVTDLPTLPHVVSQILEKTRNSDASIEEVANLIATDQALVSTYLRLVNSAFY